MPKPYPLEFRREVIAAARDGEASVRQVSSHYGISETCLKRWLRIADREDHWITLRPDSVVDEGAALREARRRIRELEQEVEVMRQAVVYLAQSVVSK